MASPFGLFGGAAPRIRRLQVPEFDPLAYAPPLMDAPQPEMPVRQRQNATNPAPAASTPPMGMIGSMAPKMTATRAAAMKRTAADASPTANKQDDGGWLRMFGYRPDETGMEVGEWLFSSAADVRNAKAERAAIAAQAAAEEQRRQQRAEIVGLLGPQAGIVFDTNPEKLGEYVGERFGDAVLSEGQTRNFGIDVPKANVTADKYGMDGGIAYVQGPQGFREQGRRGPSYTEENSQATLEETIRNNDMADARGWAGIDVDRDRLDLDRLKAEAEKGPDFSQENTLRNQYLGQAKTFQDVRSAHARIKAVGQATNPAEQMALIFGYMKMLDPGSTVREGEYATAQNTTGIPGWVMNAYNKAKDGVFLDRTQVKNFLEQADQQMASAERSYAETLDQYRNLAARYRMDPSIIQDMRSPGAGPTPGQRREHAAGVLGGSGEFDPADFQGVALDLQIQRIPRAAINDLMADPSQEAIAEFNEAFGQPGMAERILNGSRQ